MFLVDWLGYTPSDPTWKLIKNLIDATNVVAKFHHRYPNKPNPGSSFGTHGSG